MNESAGLPGDVPDLLEPRLGIVGRRREVDLDPRLVEGGTRERHQVLPADEPADAGETGVDRLEPVAVAEAPHHSLVIRRHQLAMAQRELAILVEDEERVVERPAVELVDADGENERVLLGGGADPLRLCARNSDRLARKAGPQLFPALAPDRERPRPP